MTITMQIKPQRRTLASAFALALVLCAPLICSTRALASEDAGRKKADEACAACHGPTYKGNGSVPALAGRSPSGLVRQLHDFKTGSRNGAGAAMMKPEVANMTDDMRLDIAAYLASLDP